MQLLLWLVKRSNLSLTPDVVARRCVFGKDAYMHNLGVKRSILVVDS